MITMSYIELFGWIVLAFLLGGIVAIWLAMQAEG